MGEVIGINQNEPHVTYEIICVKCCERVVAIVPERALLREIECPGCKEVGYCIDTGQYLEQVDYEGTEDHE